MRYHILVVDNNPRLQGLIRDMLVEERADCKVETASTALEALRVIKREPVDILITDWQMPQTDGLTLIETVQQLCPETHAILTTTADKNEIREHSRNRSASFRLFGKPFVIEVFLGHIDQVLAQVGREKVHRKDSRRFKPVLRPALGFS